MNGYLGRHSRKEGKNGCIEGKIECTLFGIECESVIHVLWECYT